jgi:hypothetical protein
MVLLVGAGAVGFAVIVVLVFFLLGRDGEG